MRRSNTILVKTLKYWNKYINLTFYTWIIVKCIVFKFHELQNILFKSGFF